MTTRQLHGLAALMASDLSIGCLRSVTGPVHVSEETLTHSMCVLTGRCQTKYLDAGESSEDASGQDQLLAKLHELQVSGSYSALEDFLKL